MTGFEVVFFSILGGTTATVLLVGIAHCLGIVPEDNDEM